MIRDVTRILKNILDYDPEDEEELAFTQVFRELDSIDGIDILITISSDNRRTLHSNLIKKKNSISFFSLMSIKSLQFELKNLQQRGLYEIGANFDYSSMDEDNFLNFTRDPSNWLSNGSDARPILTALPSRKFLDSLKLIGIAFEISSLPFNGESTPYLFVIKGSTSSASMSKKIYRNQRSKP